MNDEAKQTPTTCTSGVKHKPVQSTRFGTPDVNVIPVPDRLRVVKVFILTIYLMLLSEILGFRDRSKTESFPRPSFKRRQGRVSFLTPVSEKQLSLRDSISRL